MLKIQNSVAVITGGGSGIGLALARYWIENGGKAVLADIAREPLEAAQNLLGGETAAVVCDVTSEADCARPPDKSIMPPPKRPCRSCQKPLLRSFFEGDCQTGSVALPWRRAMWTPPWSKG